MFEVEVLNFWFYFRKISRKTNKIIKSVYNPQNFGEVQKFIKQIKSNQLWNICSTTIKFKTIYELSNWNYIIVNSLLPKWLS